MIYELFCRKGNSALLIKGMIFISRIRRGAASRRVGAKERCLFLVKNLNSSRIYATPQTLNSKSAEFFSNIKWQSYGSESEISSPDVYRHIVINRCTSGVAMGVIIVGIQ